MEPFDDVVVRDEKILVLEVEATARASGVRYLEYDAINVLFHGVGSI